VRDLLRQSNAKLLEIEQMVLGVQTGASPRISAGAVATDAFALDTYLAELERAEAAYKNHFGALRC